MNEGIAIVGMACRYPDAKTPGELWENVLARRRAFRRIPSERLQLDDFLTSDRNDPDGLYATEAAVLEGYEFDRVRFRVVGSTYRSADLTHWLALDVASQALEDAGFPDAEGLPRDATGVLLGNSLTGEFSRANLMRLRWPYVRRVLAAELAGEGWETDRIGGFLGRMEASYKEPFPPPGDETLAGGLSNTIAGRICNQFDLHGGGYTLDGACSSSLLAVANACSAIAAGDLDAALAGGVDLSIDPFELVGFARTGALAPEEMRVYDVRSAGFIPGEGCGFVLLMRESLARSLGCRIRAIVRGWGISSDGHGGISRPEAEGQKLALARAYRRAGFPIDTVGYFEGHGTGTSVGDAAELSALSSARREANPEAPRAPLGSIKANIGHTKAAAGAAGLLKAVLALEAQILPPTTGCEDPHPELRSPGATLRVLESAEAWPVDRPLRAAVSAMGFGGINAHVVLEGEGGSRRRGLDVHERALDRSPQDAEILFFTAADGAALATRLEGLRDLGLRLSRAELADLSAELHRRLEAGPARAALVVSRPADLQPAVDKVLAWLREGKTSGWDLRTGAFLGQLRSGMAGANGGKSGRRIGFLFTGQGSPSYLAGGLLRRRFESLEAVYGLGALDPSADPVDTAVAQPAILTHSLAALALLDRLGLRASIAVGHSLGEITALHWGGAFDAEAALALARARGAAMADLAGQTGGMLSLGADAEATSRLLAGTEAVVAAFNGPRRTVVSGPLDALAAVEERAQRQGIDSSRLRVSHAFHSPLVSEAVAPLLQALAAHPVRPLSRPVVSTVTGAALAADADLADLLARQVVQPVRYTEALAAARDQADLWIEVGPGRALSELAMESLDVPILALDSGGPSISGLLKAVGAAFAAGVPVRTEALFAGRFVRPFDLDRPLRFLANPCESAPPLASSTSPDSAERKAERPKAGELWREILASRAASAPAPPVPAPAAPAPAFGPDTLSPLDVLRALVAERTELPVEAVRGESRLLSDLHLNSISVGQLVSEAARRIGARPPASPTDYAQATIAEIAAVLAQQAAAPGAASPSREDEEAPAGVDSWVRPFAVELVPRPIAASSALPPTSDGSWKIVAPPDHPLAEGLRHRLPGRGVALLLPSPTDEGAIPYFVAAARAALAVPPGDKGAVRFLLVQEGGVGGGFARTLHLEHPEVPTRVVDLPLAHPQALDWIVAEVAAGGGFAEAWYDLSGERRVPVLRPLDSIELLDASAPLGALPIGPDDVLLVSGGGKGIAAECALDLARTSGARLALLGRSRPESDAELAANLDRMRAAGLQVAYASADVTDGEAVRAALDLLRAELGPVTALLHSAGANTPRLLSSLDEEGFQRTFAPKAAGLRNLLASLDTGRLRLLVTFGSIIGRTGLKGEADYAVANEWLARATERFAAEHPDCRSLCLEWSVWAGVGMGERLGTLESLIRQGITPIPPNRGVELLRDLLRRPASAVSLVVSGRFGSPPTLEVERRELPLLRYLETPRVHFPGIELVVDAEVSADTDPHLADHVFRGEPLFAAVLGLEAMAQAAMALTGSTVPPTFENAVFQRPVAIQPGRKTTIRVAALVREHGKTVEVVLREASTHFAADHFRVLCRFGERLDPTPALVLTLTGEEKRLDLSPEDLYGDVLFHRGRFRRVEGYRHLRATECLADIGPDGTAAWFGRYLPDRLVLGDPGVHDAAIHGIQACIPHATLLPTGVERIENFGVENNAPMVLAARERSRNGNDFVYDLEVLGIDGQVRERWTGLQLRAVDRITPPSSWTTALLSPYVERRMQELFPASGGVRVALAGAGEGRARSGRRDHRPATSSLTGGEAVRHAPDGRPSAPNGAQISVAHAGPLVLSVTGPGRVGCDLEAVVEREPGTWRDLLGAERFGLAELITRERGETPDGAATRVWAAAESLKKAGAPHGAPLTLEGTADDGWLSFRSGGLVIGTFLGPVRDLHGPAALAVAVESPS